MVKFSFSDLIGVIVFSFDPNTFSSDNTVNIINVNVCTIVIIHKLFIFFPVTTTSVYNLMQ
eukprot:Awhi_evm1s5517